MFKKYSEIEEFIRTSPAGWKFATKREKRIINKAIDDARDYAKGNDLMNNLLKRYDDELDGAGDFDALDRVLDRQDITFLEVFEILSTYP